MFNHKNTMHTCIVVSSLLLLLAPIGNIHGSPGGAPPTACASMIPGHGVPSQISSSPFSTELPNGETAFMDSAVRLELRSHNGITTFKGFLLMAFDKDDTEAKPIGTFKFPSNGQIIDCLDGMKNAATHINNGEKKLVTVEWIPPTNYMGQVVFRTTYVQNKETFWVKTESKVVSFVMPTEPTVPVTVPTTKATTPSSSASQSSSNTLAGLLGLSLLAALMR